MPLTDSAIKAAKPKEKPYKLSDAQGLYLLINPNGSKLWRFKYRVRGTEKGLALGTYPTVTLLQARKKRDDARQQLAEGKDPSLERKVQREAEIIDSLTFEVIAREWHEYRRPRWAKSTADKTMAYLESDLIPALGKKPFKAITRPDLVALVRSIEARGAFNVAKKSRQWLSQIFRYGLAKGVIELNPATDLDVVAAHAPRSGITPTFHSKSFPSYCSELRRHESTC